MKTEDFEELPGGNMNRPLKKDSLIYKEAHEASETIHRLLCHVRNRGITWIPESFGIQQGRHILSYIEGEVPPDSPSWLWNEDLLADLASRLRQWHDATEDFPLADTTWLLKNDDPREVICHCDFAPYNIVFRDHRFAGLIDFDVCAPGSRLWDMAYALYRFIPLLPESPFSTKEKIGRIGLFLDAYGRGDRRFDYTLTEVLLKVQKRLQALSEWSREYGEKNGKGELIRHSEMYRDHADWVISLIS